MASGTTHFLITGLMALALMAGGFAVDLDHLKMFGGNHNLKQAWSAFKGTNYVSAERNDSQHLFHKPKTYKAVFLAIATIVMFGIGYFTHLKLDGVI